MDLESQAEDGWYKPYGGFTTEEWSEVKSMLDDFNSREFILWEWIDGLEEAIAYCSNHEEQSDWCNDVVLKAFWDEFARLEFVMGSGLDKQSLDKYYDDLGQKRKNKVD